ncbi:hypothetical protein ACFPK1_21860 [Actinomycetospora rhizophila]|uniref:Uncharacterized protein n=1 Tax=Actinomycetospora rhizophila TaxID=1416876 RepID=A0ABV9ZJU0_9PSEU
MSSATLAEPRTGTSTRTEPRRQAGRDTGRDSGRDAARRPGTRPAGGATTTTADVRSGGTAPFVLLIMVLLTGGLVATLWLSTAAAADSYRLDEARQVARDLSEQTERLHRDVAAAQSAPALAAAARAQGMVPAGEPAVLLVAPDGSSQVIGDAKPAQAAAPPPAPPVDPAQQNPGQQNPAQQNPGQQALAQDTNGAQAATDGQPAPAPAGAAAAEDHLTAVPSTQPGDAETTTDDAAPTPAGR